METEALKLQLKQIETKLRDMATSKHKEEMAERVIKDVLYFAEHVDEFEYGVGVLRNLMIYLGLNENGRYTPLSNTIVLNTMRYIYHEIDELKAGKSLADPDCLNRKDTLTPGSKKLFRGKGNFIDGCEDGTYTCHFKVGKNGSAPTLREVFDVIEHVIETAESA